MGKELIKIMVERDNLNQKWGIVIQGGRDMALTAKIATVKVTSFTSLSLHPSIKL